MRCHCRLSVRVNTYTLKSRFQHRWRDGRKLLAAADHMGLRVAAAPDIFLGPSIQRAKSVHALLSFSSRAEATFMASWDVWAHGMHAMEIYGTRGSIRVPNPNWFSGTVEIYRETKREWE